MELYVKGSPLADKGFADWLIPKIRAYIINFIKHYEWDRWEPFIEQLPRLSSTSSRSVTPVDVVTYACSTLISNPVYDGVKIQFNPHTMLPGFDRVPVDIVIRAFDYGVLGIKACPIFSDTFHHFAENIDTFLRLYYNL